MQMPLPDAAVVGRREEIAAALRRIVPGEGVIVSEPERRAYESDGLTAYRQSPLVVVLPSATAQVAAILRYCKSEGIKVVPRGAGTSLSGGALPLADGVLLGMAKFNRILDIDYDIAGVMTGSEGLLGVVTEVTVRILRKPPTARALLIGFPSTEDAGNCVAAVIGAGIIPGGMEMMDRPAIHAAEAFVEAGYPLDVDALLIIELDGPSVEVDELILRVEKIARSCGCVTLQISNSEDERLLFWAGRKAAFPAVGRISPDYLCMDGTIPRGKLPEALARIRSLSDKHGLAVANVFHAGDGNLHPLILYDANKPGEMDAAEKFGADILRVCVELGGVLTGEHGVGIEKRDLMPASNRWKSSVTARSG